MKGQMLMNDIACHWWWSEKGNDWEWEDALYEPITFRTDEKSLHKAHPKNDIYSSNLMGLLGEGARMKAAVSNINYLIDKKRELVHR